MSQRPKLPDPLEVDYRRRKDEWAEKASRGEWAAYPTPPAPSPVPPWYENLPRLPELPPWDRSTWPYPGQPVERKTRKDPDAYNPGPNYPMPWVRYALQSYLSTPWQDWLYSHFRPGY